MPTHAIAAVCREFDTPLQASALQFPMTHPADERAPLDEGA